MRTDPVVTRWRDPSQGDRDVTECEDLCLRCDKPLGPSPSDFFCSDLCQQWWYARHPLGVQSDTGATDAGT